MYAPKIIEIIAHIFSIYTLDLHTKEIAAKVFGTKNLCSIVLDNLKLNDKQKYYMRNLKLLYFLY